MASTSTGVTSEASTSAEQQYQCKDCDAVYENKLMLSKHYNTCHKHNNTYLCTKCNYTTGYLGNLKNHSSIHLNDMYYCVICSKQFHTFRELTDHETDHKRMMSNRYQCNICPNTFPSFNNLRIHHNISHSFSHSLYICGICDKDISTLQEFQDHQNVHKCTKSNMFVCTICRNQNFYLFCDLLNHHIQVHLDKVLYICMICDGVWKSRFLSEHYNNCHRLNGNWVCAKCDYTTAQFKDLEIHAKQTHLYDKFYCMICDKHLYTKHEYNTHRDSHKWTTSNRYRCGICEPIKEFDTFSLLRRHHEMDHLNK